MEIVKVKLNEKLHYGTKTFEVGDVGTMPIDDFNAIKKSGINIELIIDKPIKDAK